MLSCIVLCCVLLYFVNVLNVIVLYLNLLYCVVQQSEVRIKMCLETIYVFFVQQNH